MVAPLALILGIVLALTVKNPWPAQTKKLQTWLLQGSVVALGAGMNLDVLLKVGASGLGYTVLGITVTFALTWALMRVLGTERVTSLLIGTGTAICGGSAIAAAGPAMGAKNHEMSVALGVVFLLNGVALLIFPPIGHAFGMSEAQFGLWSALAIHDTSSVVGASMQYGAEALALATTVKLARALWIIPVTAVLARVVPHDRGSAKRSYPWFIVAFVAMAALVTFIPALTDPGKQLAAFAKWTLVASLFFVGLGVSREALKQVGIKPLLLGVMLWVLVSAGTLAAILTSSAS